MVSQFQGCRPEMRNTLMVEGDDREMLLTSWKLEAEARKENKRQTAGKDKTQSLKASPQ